MKAKRTTSKLVLVTALLALAFSGCGRQAEQTSSGASGSSGTGGSQSTAAAKTEGKGNTADTSSNAAGTSASGTGGDTSTASTGSSGSSGTLGTSAATSDANNGSSGTSGSSSSGSSGSGGGSTATLGTAIDDSVITTKVKTALMADSDIKGTDISVETKKGEVLLSGFVNNQTQVDEALKVANAVEGVKKVTNKMVVKQ